MEPVLVTGRFVNENHEPVPGCIEFIPSKIWVEDGDLTYPCLAAHVELDGDGQFAVMLTRTDTGMYGWHYTVKCPVGTWTIKLEDEGPLMLKDLLPKRFSS